MTHERRWAIFFEMSMPQKLMWLSVLAFALLILFVWVPYRMPDDSIQFGWFWSPPTISKGKLEHDLATIAKRNPAAVGGRAVAKVVVDSEHEPAPIWWSRSRSWVRIIVLIAFVVHVIFAVMKH